MWKRRKFHECAEELEILSRDFRDAYTNKSRIDQQSREKILQESSQKGIEILRVLALSIRSERYFGSLPSIHTTVGALNALWLSDDLPVDGVALLQREEINLTRWLPDLPCRGMQAQSKQRRLSRWLHNSRLNVHRLYKPLIQAALADWGEECLDLSLDTSLFWDECCLIRLAVVHRGRALPVVWRVLWHRRASVAFDEYSATNW